MPDYKLITFEETNSTNDHAKKNLHLFEDKTVVSAEKQIKGRGRLNREWISQERNNIYVSIILKPKQSKNVPSFKILPQYTSVIICEVLKKYGIKANIKWPNDILVKGKKIAGILIESSIQGEQIKGYVIGIGINLNLDRQVIAKINQPATSLNLETGKTIDKNAFLNELIQAFFNGYESFIEKGFSIIKPEYLSRCSFLGEQITVKNLTDKQTGIAKRINDEGFLILEQNGKESVILSGDISY